MVLAGAVGAPLAVQCDCCCVADVGAEGCRGVGVGYQAYFARIRCKWCRGYWRCRAVKALCGPRCAECAQVAC